MVRKKGRGGGVQEGSGPRKWDKYDWVRLDAELGSGSPELLAAWPEERRDKAMQWKSGSVQEKAETLTSEELTNGVMNNAEYANIVLVREFQEVVAALTGQVTILKAGKYANERMMKGSERECEKLRAEVARQEDMAEEERKEIQKEWERICGSCFCVQKTWKEMAKTLGESVRGMRVEKTRDRDSAANARGGCKKGGGGEEVAGGG